MPDNNDIQLTNTRLDIQALPDNFSRVYQMYVLQQSADIEKLAKKANTAGQDATQAQAKNEAQAKALSQLEKTTVSKTLTATQTLKSALDATGFQVKGVPVVGQRIDGFSPATGTAYQGPFNADADYNTDDLATGLKETRQRLKALEDALRAHGLIA